MANKITLYIQSKLLNIFDKIFLIYFYLFFAFLIAFTFWLPVRYAQDIPKDVIPIFFWIIFIWMLYIFEIKKFNIFKVIFDYINNNSIYKIIFVLTLTVILLYFSFLYPVLLNIYKKIALNFIL